MEDNMLWQVLYDQGFAERVHRLGFGGLTASECGKIGRIFSGKGKAEKGEKVEVEEVALEGLTISALKKQHMRERTRSLDNSLQVYSLTGVPFPPSTLWESRRREMRRWYRLVTTDPFARLWSVELAENYVGDISLYGIGQEIGNRFFFYVAANELRTKEFVMHVLSLWLKKMPLLKWQIKTIASPVFRYDEVMLEALAALGFHQTQIIQIGREPARILAYKILNS
ncbi:MAG: hypothetical protein PHD88_03455 [Firmicutes bacterium]|nr:hypothetical protein [Bacillota bacterium]MDD4264493.1 hypothetical protein [Bacillota bacterium]MDD4693448.1 hypothetical protein [Bacillota bacterium]